MLFEDGGDQTFSAIRRLESHKDELRCPDVKILPLQKFLDHAQSVRLTHREKEILVEQATLLIDQFYAHLPFKRARYATDPVQRFRLIQAQLHQYPTDLAFHDEMIQAFLRLRDAHTFYGMPAPYRGAFAFLPFRMDCYGEPGQRHFLVTNVMDGFEHERFGVGAEITFWQGMPVKRAIEREADHEMGCNPASRFVRGLKRMTKRNLSFSLPPDELSALIQYIPAGDPDASALPVSHRHVEHGLHRFQDSRPNGAPEQFCIALPWSVAMSFLPGKKRKGSRSSVNESMAELKHLSELLWQHQQFAIDRKPSRHNAPAAGAGIARSGATETGENRDPRQESVYPHVFEFQYTGGAPHADSVDPAQLHDPANSDKKFGYVRIKTFELDPANESSQGFVDEFKRILVLMQKEAPDGLILDVRSNPGGAIDAAERILQLMTPCRIEPAKFHFINSRLTQQIAFALNAQTKNCRNANQLEWGPWVSDLLASVTSGDFVTTGQTLTPSDDANSEDQQCYQGPVTLLIDASSYSATDIFAAGFQDHGIGPVIGVDENTGGGGANRWLHEQLLENIEHVAPSIPLEKLPRDAQMGLAIRRSSRVGLNGGNFLEDEGVKRNVPYAITRNDILKHDQDLLRFACNQLGAQPTRSLKIVKVEPVGDDGILLSVETHNVYRIDCFLDGLRARVGNTSERELPQCSFAVVDGMNNFWVPTAGLVYLPPSQLRVDSYAKVGEPGVEHLQLIAKATFTFQPEAAAPEALAAQQSGGDLKL